MSRTHECNCSRRPDCADHRAQEWGGGLGDICAPHDHGPALREAAQAVLTELDIIRRHRERTGAGHLVVHIDTHEDLRAALAKDSR